MEDENQNKLMFKLGEMTQALKDLAEHVKKQNGRIHDLEKTEEAHEIRWQKLYVVLVIAGGVWGVVAPFIVLFLKDRFL